MQIEQKLQKVFAMVHSHARQFQVYLQLCKAYIHTYYMHACSRTSIHPFFTCIYSYMHAYIQVCILTIIGMS